MKRGLLAIALLLVAACGSSRKADDEPTTVPSAQPINAPSLETQLANLQTSMTELLDRLDVMNERIARLEGGAPASGGQPVAAQPPSAVPRQTASNPQPQPKNAPSVLHAADVAENYRRALMLIGQGKHAEARAAFQRVFDADPTGHLADNALFWIGESYYATGDYQSAMRYYERVTKEFAEENKAPDAMFKLGVAYEKTGDLGMARRTLEQCIQKYPYSSPAASAKQELKRIKY